jgi:hypothetical protein
MVTDNPGLAPIDDRPMPQWLPPLMTFLFAIHLAVFGRLAVRRGEAYYWLLCALFTALTASFALRWLAPELAVGSMPLHLAARYGAWGLACVTLPLLVLRVMRRSRRGRST